MKLETYLEQHGVTFEKHTHGMTYTAQALAGAEHISGYMVAKPVVVKSGSRFAMCVLPAPAHVELDRVADVLNEPFARLATESEMAELFPDCELGAEPPIGELYGLETIIDEQLEQDEHIWMQAGTHTDAVRVRRDDWQRVCHAIVAPIARV